MKAPECQNLIDFLTVMVFLCVLFLYFESDGRFPFCPSRSVLLSVVREVCGVAWGCKRASEAVIQGVVSLSAFYNYDSAGLVTQSGQCSFGSKLLYKSGKRLTSFIKQEERERFGNYTPPTDMKTLPC